MCQNDGRATMKVYRQLTADEQVTFLAAVREVFEGTEQSALRCFDNLPPMASVILRFGMTDACQHELVRFYRMTKLAMAAGTGSLNAVKSWP